METRYAIPDPVEYWELSMYDFVEGNAPDWVKDITYGECDLLNIIVYDPGIDDVRLIRGYEGQTYLVNYGKDEGIYGFNKIKRIHRGNIRYNEFMTLDELILDVSTIDPDRWAGRTTWMLREIKALRKVMEAARYLRDHDWVGPTDLTSYYGKEQLKKALSDYEKCHDKEEEKNEE